jgi:hypothetical protein
LAVYVSAGSALAAESAQPTTIDWAVTAPLVTAVGAVGGLLRGGEGGRGGA